MCCLCCCKGPCCDFMLIILAFVCPPLPVWIKRGFFSPDFLINICLCLLGWIPGTIHAWYIILKSPQDQRVYDQESHPVYYRLHLEPSNQQQQPPPPQQQQSGIHFTHPQPFAGNNDRHTNSTTYGELSPLSDPAPIIDYGSSHTTNDYDAPPPDYEETTRDSKIQYN